MTIRTIMAAMMAVATATGVSAQDTAPAPALATAPAKPVVEKKICRADAATGSILARRRCFTRTEWTEIERKSGKHNAKDVDKFGDAIRTLHGLGPNR